MKLSIGNIYVKDVVLGEANGFAGGVLTIDKQAAIDYLMGEDDHITSLDIVIAHPGDDTRIVPVIEIVEPRVRTDGRCLFPGVTDELVPAGDGELKAFKGCCITSVGGTYGSFGDGVIDMGGEGAKFTYWSQLINICLVGETDEEFEYHEQQKCNHAMRWAAHRLAEYVGKIATDVEVEDTETYVFDPVLKRSAERNALPNVAIVLQPQSQMEAMGYNDLIYGWDMNHFVPTFVSPTEILDGCLISGSFMPSSSKWATYEMQNFPTIKELFAEDGKTLNFVGVILSNLNVALDQKERSAIMVRNIALNLGVDYAIVTEEGYGNPDADYVRCQVILEDAGIPVVGISNECTGRDGMSQPLVTLDEKMTALVSTGNVSELCELPACKTVIGNLEAMNRDGMSGSWGYDEKLGKSGRDDGSIIMEDNNWFCGDHIAGYSVKTMLEV
ncbi:glycine/sarcosine/betaine reductase component B subunit [Thermophilibacter immobilis]|jgi:glycine reductase|uniref:Glycine/sarcosine/betaine reductase component B subunit n=1 Tax=Thermophilibacter immobilis TaxID=2779519 RepID=A0A7S7M867_9ACTN|nr:glycine/sarcosine/betaine reductase component B subunit [Thermophilibacter immobilis]QOY60232.1 glycine/sarcosine/betaine reductase component B subunit [Thermophilibacter immobilis]